MIDNLLFPARVKANISSIPINQAPAISQGASPKPKFRIKVPSGGFNASRNVTSLVEELNNDYYGNGSNLNSRNNTQN